MGALDFQATTGSAVIEVSYNISPTLIIKFNV